MKLNYYITNKEKSMSVSVKCLISYFVVVELLSSYCVVDGGKLTLCGYNMFSIIFFIGVVNS